MRKVIAFGPADTFMELHGESLSRHGFEPIRYSSKFPAKAVAEQAPVIVVFSEFFDKTVEAALNSVVSIERRAPIIFIQSSGVKLSPVLSKIKRKARYVLDDGLTKSDFIGAVKACSESYLR